MKDDLGVTQSFIVYPLKFLFEISWETDALLYTEYPITTMSLMNVKSAKIPQTNLFEKIGVETDRILLSSLAHIPSLCPSSLQDKRTSRALSVVLR